MDYLSNNQIKINRHKIFVNNNEISLVVEQMIEKVQEALFPIICSLNATGEIIGIKNHKEIKNRWQSEIKPKISQYYKKELAENLISKLDHFYESIQNKTSVLNLN